ncbi:MAG: hypothetical protein WAU74_13240, partial [Pseudolabrys sp.]
MSKCICGKKLARLAGEPGQVVREERQYATIGAAESQGTFLSIPLHAKRTGPIRPPALDIWNVTSLKLTCGESGS